SASGLGPCLLPWQSRRSRRSRPSGLGPSCPVGRADLTRPSFQAWGPLPGSWGAVLLPTWPWVPPSFRRRLTPDLSCSSIHQLIALFAEPGAPPVGQLAPTGARGFIALRTHQHQVRQVDGSDFVDDSALGGLGAAPSLEVALHHHQLFHARPT